MRAKNSIIIIVVLIFLINTVNGEANDSNINQSNPINFTESSKSSENKIYGTNQLDDIFLRELEMERELLAQKQQTYDSFLSTILIWLTLFGIILALIGFVFYKNIKEIKEDVTKELDRNLSDKAQTIIKETMKSTYEKPISDLGERITKLENRVEKFMRSKGQKKLPEYSEENESEKKEAQGKNIFED